MSLDNQTYKDTYHFKNRRAYANPYGNASSITPDNPEINATIGKNDERANVEIEKGELILQPDLSGLHTAIGKRHSGGGVNVNLKPNTFVFSDDKTLAFSEKEQELFEFKMGGKTSKRLNTPAQVLKRNVNPKHYNTLVANIRDAKKDAITKNSSTMMLEKYIQTLGNVAYLQEAKKDFPTGIPEFSEGTAPVYKEEVKDNVMSQKQYAKFGGKITNPYEEEMAPGGIFLPIEPYRKSRTKQGSITPTRQLNHYNRGPEYLQKWEQAIPGISKLDNKEAQARIYDYMASSDSGLGAISEMWRKYGLTNEGKKYKDLVGMTNNGVFDQTKELDPTQIAALKKAYTDGMFGVRQLEFQNQEAPPLAEVTMPNVTVTSTPRKKMPVPTPGTINPPEQGVTEIETAFTPEQRIAQGYANFKYANAKRYMPYRSRMNASYVDPMLVNPEQVISDVQGSANSQIASLNSLSPILRNAQAQGMAGQMFNQLAGIRSQYDNQNAQITNQTRAMNNQIRNNTTGQNMQNDQQYYRESVAGRQNYDNLKGFLADQAMNTRTQHVQENEQLAWNLLTQQNPVYGFDFKHNRMYRKPVNMMDVPPSGNSREDILEIADKLKGQGYSEKLIGDIIKSRVFQNSQPRAYKRGGRFLNPYNNVKN